MMTFYFRFYKISFFATFAAITSLMAGCTTMKPAQDCKPYEKARLESNIAPTKAQLARYKIERSRVRVEMIEERCTGSLFSPAAKSASCERLGEKLDRLQTLIETLDERLTEMNAAVAGRPSTENQVKSCKASWIPVRTVKKTAPKKSNPTLAVSRQQAKPAHVRQAKAAHKRKEFIPDYTVPEKPKPDPVAYTPPSQPIATGTAQQNAVMVTPPAERQYLSDNPGVRLVGSSFFPDQSTPVDQPIPVREPAQ